MLDYRDNALRERSHTITACSCAPLYRPSVVVLLPDFPPVVSGDVGSVRDDFKLSTTSFPEKTRPSVVEALNRL